ncbi:hypothetical protein [Micromonospora cathayae]|uniref:Uncharacterized protein n=1 Tax=Micromonospora cathayae TaxID=3028804 RepID=A0ABY7ZGZ2_9ACTN|nr:hypothetical protein [Micromonospora sp. HUAS 3]WDZ82265.1 hypothetical protein PVK37_17340 [Micromonospora sp. HUAS 3]
MPFTVPRSRAEALVSVTPALVALTLVAGTPAPLPTTSASPSATPVPLSTTTPIPVSPGPDGPALTSRTPPPGAPGIRQVGLTVTVPSGPVHLGATAPGGQLTGHLGSIAVDDDRLLGGSWTTTVSATSFTTGAGGPARTVGAGRVRYWSGPATRNTGTLAVHPGQRAAADAVALDSVRTAFQADLDLLFLSSVGWNPSLIIDLPTGVVAGRYTGTVTHSVS